MKNFEKRLELIEAIDVWTETQEQWLANVSDYDFFTCLMNAYDVMSELDGMVSSMSERFDIYKAVMSKDYQIVEGWLATSYSVVNFSERSFLNQNVALIVNDRNFYFDSVKDAQSFVDDFQECTYLFKADVLNVNRYAYAVTRDFEHREFKDLYQEVYQDYDAEQYINWKKTGERFAKRFTEYLQEAQEKVDFYNKLNSQIEEIEEKPTKRIKI